MLNTIKTKELTLTQKEQLIKQLQREIDEEAEFREELLAQNYYSLANRMVSDHCFVEKLTTPLSKTQIEQLLKPNLKSGLMELQKHGRIYINGHSTSSASLIDPKAVIMDEATLRRVLPDIIERQFSKQMQKYLETQIKEYSDTLSTFKANKKSAKSKMRKYQKQAIKEQNVNN